MWHFLPWGSQMSHHFQHCIKFLGTLVAPKHFPITAHITFAIGQVKNKCAIDSWSQKWHIGLPIQFLLIKLSFVKMAPFSISHIKNLILAGTFPLHIYLKNGQASFLVSPLYKDLTEKRWFLSSLKVMTSGPSWSWNFSTSAQILSQQKVICQPSPKLKLHLPIFHFCYTHFLLFTQNENNWGNCA